jgi:hypothetical protein
MFPIERGYRSGTDIVLMHGAFVIGGEWRPVYEILIRDGVLGPVSGQSAIGIWLLPKSVCPDAVSRTRSVSGFRLRQQAYSSPSPSRRQLGWRLDGGWRER